MICVRIGFAIVCTSDRLSCMCNQQPHQIMLRSCVKCRGTSFREEFQNFVHSAAGLGRAGCRRLGPAFARAAAHTLPMGEHRAWYTTLGLVALALALGSGSESGSGLRLGPRSDYVAHELAGSPRVIDRDTIAIGTMRIGLEGIGAPEAAQTCGRKGGGTWACGGAATLALSARIGSKAVDCAPRGRDRYGRTLAVCFLDGGDINTWMVRQGHAWPSCGT